jgi:hypothetical protein
MILENGWFAGKKAAEAGGPCLGGSDGLGWLREKFPNVGTQVVRSKDPHANKAVFETLGLWLR